MSVGEGYRDARWLGTIDPADPFIYGDDGLTNAPGEIVVFRGSNLSVADFVLPGGETGGNGTIDLGYSFDKSTELAAIDPDSEAPGFVAELEGLGGAGIVPLIGDSVLQGYEDAANGAQSDADQFVTGAAEARDVLGAVTKRTGDTLDGISGAAELAREERVTEIARTAGKLIAAIEAIKRDLITEENYNYLVRRELVNRCKNTGRELFSSVQRLLNKSAAEVVAASEGIQADAECLTNLAERYNLQATTLARLLEEIKQEQDEIERLVDRIASISALEEDVTEEQIILRSRLNDLEQKHRDRVGAAVRERRAVEGQELDDTAIIEAGEMLTEMAVDVQSRNDLPPDVRAEVEASKGLSRRLNRLGMSKADAEAQADRARLRQQGQKDSAVITMDAIRATDGTLTQQHIDMESRMRRIQEHKDVLSVLKNFLTMGISSETDLDRMPKELAPVVEAYKAHEAALKELESNREGDVSDSPEEDYSPNALTRRLEGVVGPEVMRDFESAGSTATILQGVDHTQQRWRSAPLAMFRSSNPRHSTGRRTTLGREK